MAADHQPREINSIGSMLSVMASARHDPVARILNVDLIAVLVAVLLPWSTSGVAIGMVLWLMALAATLELRPFLRSLRRPICALPIALVALAALGTLWSDAPWGARVYALSPVTKLLALPFLFYHFERSTRGMWVFIAFLASCTLLTVVSWIVAIDPGLSLKLPDEPRGAAFSSRTTSIRARNSCCARWCWRIRSSRCCGRKDLAGAVADAIAASFIVNMVFVIVSRTAMVTMPVMLAVFAMVHLKWRTNVLLAVGRPGGLAWAVSPQLQGTTDKFTRDYRLYKESMSRLRSGCGSNSGRSRWGSLPRRRDRPRHRIDARIVRGGRDRACSAAQAGDRQSA